ncbi:MAG TPA: hypothetical protein VFO48_01170, partial [Vicinamibacterales bacterium]|nr:hypothetical protein [Vicinamibacterales bacterium]
MEAITVRLKRAVHLQADTTYFGYRFSQTSRADRNGRRTCGGHRFRNLHQIVVCRSIDDADAFRWW